MKKNSVLFIVNIATLVALVVTLSVFIARLDARSLQNQLKDTEQDVILKEHDVRLNNSDLDRAEFHATINEQYKHIVIQLDDLKDRLSDRDIQ